MTKKVIVSFCNPVFYGERGKKCTKIYSLMRLCLSARGEMLSMVLPDVAELCAATICIIRGSFSRSSSSYLEREIDV